MGLTISFIPFFIHINKVKEVELVKYKRKKIFNNVEYTEIPLDGVNT